MITQQEWRKERNAVKEIVRSMLRGCVEESESEREEIWRNNDKKSVTESKRGIEQEVEKGRAR